VWLITLTWNRLCIASLVMGEFDVAGATEFIRDHYYKQLAAGYELVAFESTGVVQRPLLLEVMADFEIALISLMLHNPYVAEVYVLGILPEIHRKGVGRKLMAQSFAWLREQKLEYMQVKTLGTSHPDKG
jgi:GNAT superfamily N-acetyltransferase